MNDLPEAPSYAIGACFNCRQIYLMTPTQRDCPLCLKAAKAWAPFAGAEQDALWTAVRQAEPVAPGGDQYAEEAECPACGTPVIVTLTANGMELTMAAVPAAAAGAEPAAGVPYESRRSVASEPAAAAAAGEIGATGDAGDGERLQTMHDAGIHDPPAEDVERVPAAETDAP